MSTPRTELFRRSADNHGKHERNSMRIEVKAAASPETGTNSPMAALQKQLISLQKQLSALTKQLANTTDRDARQLIRQQIEALQQQIEMIQEQMKRLAMPAEQKGGDEVPSPRKAGNSSVLRGSRVNTRA
jgi:protein subunit release factor A